MFGNISGGYYDSSHTCAVTTAGSAKCWGRDDYAQVGVGCMTYDCYYSGPYKTPVDVIGLSSGVARIAAGPGFTCALMTDTKVKCWGYNESAGHPGADSRLPVHVLTGTIGQAIVIRQTPFSNAIAIGSQDMVQASGG